MSKFTDNLAGGKTKYIFFGGKGGVGKTVMASATAIHLAMAGKRTLLCSTNPVHSLSSCFGQQFMGKGETPVSEVSNLHALEIETAATVEKYRENTRGKILDFLKYADIPIDPTPFVDAATTNPAFEESAMFDNVVDVILANKYDCYVFDTAPVAHTYRLLGMSRMYDMWLCKMIKSREETMSLKRSLSFKKDKKEVKDTMIRGLLESRQKTGEIRKLLTTPELTAFYFVTLPLALPISVVERFIYWVRAFQIPVGGVIVNQVMPLSDSRSSFVVNKQAEQKRYLELVDKKFGELVAARIPMFDGEIRGVEMLKKVLTER
ncbi:MAG TPA: ArsA family ATPase [candidate division Zixibacteria bacterium]|nr:ArsA family ATPase [candidate division Zixibacteria bacterium]